MPVRKRHDDEELLMHIMFCAEDLFGQHGYEQVSLRELLSAAAVSTTAFYARFRSKEDVVAALTSTLFAELFEQAPVVLDAAKDLETGIDLGVDLLCQQFGPRQKLVRVVLSEAGSVPGAMQARQHAYNTFATFLQGRLAGLAEKKRLPGDPRTLAWALIGALEIHVMRWAVWDEIDVAQLRETLRTTARALLPTKDKR